MPIMQIRVGWWARPRSSASVWSSAHSLLRFSSSACSATGFASGALLGYIGHILMHYLSHNYGAEVGHVAAPGALI